MVMKNKQYLMCCVCLFLMFGLAVAQKGDIDYSDLAKRIVVQSANVSEGEHVWITGSVRDMALMEEMAVEVRKVGAFPVIQVSSEQMNWRMFDEVPDKYDGQARTLALKILEIMDVQISVDVGENLNLFADADPARLALRGKSFEPVTQSYEKHNIRSVYINNGMYPTKNLAKRWEVSLDKLTKMFWQGIAADYKQVEATGMQLKKKLSATGEIHLTHANGTDLKLKIEDRPVYVSDGIISAEDIKAGFAACQAYLPAGEVIVAPVRGTAQGKVVIDRMFYAGKEINGLTLSFSAGKLVSMTSDSDISLLKAHYDAAGAGKEEFAMIDIGINPDVQIIPDSKMTSWIPAGMVSVGIGGNSWAGGDNTITYGLYGHIEGATVKADGKALVTAGKLNL